ncbi:MAG: hypothetical protein P9L92_01335 [Candidatus Electryonea clarkiae]|nr:hypothetical protein [Candidatus Electryonea clarkiae]MDP8287471.1 hypothetical protein [Candidatus Electryonea clarkiae]
MDLRRQKCLVLGGFGLVGMAVCRKLSEEGVSEIIVSSLKETEAESACQILKAEHPEIKFTPEWGDIFVREEFKGYFRGDLLADPERRITFIHDIFDPLTKELCNKITLYRQIVDHKPYAVIDCVNTATGIAYQDVYQQSEKVLSGLDSLRGGTIKEGFEKQVEDLIASISAPQLVRHITTLHQGLIDGGCRGYLKVGTTGTGGMGLNIPYTHSENRPSRVLLTKNALGGSQTLLLFLMGRTPLQQEDGSIRDIFVKEIKPATAIAWKGVVAGEIRKRGQNYPRYDMLPANALEIGKTVKTCEESGAWIAKGDTLKSVYIDTGENGIFSEGEFTAITEVGQMEFVTPEEIAQYVIWELSGGNSGHDVIGALDAAVMEPTYRAGVLRQVALDKLRQKMNAEKGLDESVAFELLGPPRLTKLLHEANLIRHAFRTMRPASIVSPEKMADKVQAVIEADAKLRSAILSVGVPILLSDGKKYLRGPRILIPTHAVNEEFEITEESLDSWCEKGWIDLRPGNMKRWQGWFNELIEQKDNRMKVLVGDELDTSSRYDFDENYFDPDSEINPGKMVGWIFINVDKGKRTKR